MDIPTLTPAQRRNLRGHAHHLHPLVMIGDAGLTPAVIAAIDLELKHHELIKVRAFSDDRGEREALLEAIGKACGCAAVQHIGKLFIVYRASSAKRLDPDLTYAESVQQATRKVIAPAGAQLTKKQAAAGKKAAKKAVRSGKKAPAKAGSRQDFAPRKSLGVPETSAARRTHLSAADRRAAYATVTERAPRPTTKPGRVTKPRRAKPVSDVAIAPVRKAPARKR
ncbi:MAG: YhbY family RNA-binding protein [Burkholderiaceae bacterium]